MALISKNVAIEEAKLLKLQWDKEFAVIKVSEYYYKYEVMMESALRKNGLDNVIFRTSEP